MEIIDPTRYHGWDDLLANHPGGSVFHTSAWAKLLIETYGYRPRYLLERSGERFDFMMPVMEVGGAVTGRKGVALPFSDYCDPLYSSEAALSGGWEQTIAEAGRLVWKTVEIRSRGQLTAGFPPAGTVYSHHQLQLRAGADAVWRAFRSSTQRNIKKAQKAGVETTVCTTLDSVERFYRLNCLTRKEHGLPPQPLKFFRNIHEHFLKAGKGFIVLATYRGRPIAANVFLLFGESAYYKYGASDRRVQHLRASNQVMWEGILRCVHTGIRSLCLGRTEPENQGLRQFKSGWGATETAVSYYRFDIAGQRFSRGRPSVVGWHNKLFKALPIPASRAIGSVLYKFMG